VQWCIPIIPALWRLRQENREFKAKLGYIARTCPKTATTNKTHTHKLIMLNERSQK
jgi:hypothetical protein